MYHNMKGETMKAISGSVATVLLGLCMAGIAWADHESVSVTGKGEIKQKPDVAYVTVYIKGEGATMVDAAKEADQKVEEIKTAVQKKHKEIQSIEVSDVTVGEAQRQVWTPDQKEEPPHPEITRRIRFATAPDPAKAYELIDTAVGAGALMQIASSVHYSDDTRSIVVYALLNPASLEAKARKDAMAGARQEADSLAALVGKKIGGVLKIGHQDADFFSHAVRIMGRDPDLPTRYFSLNAKEVTVTCALSVTFELK
jgi:uncharacterized protein YggE